MNVDEDTRFLSPDGSVTALADLPPGMVLRVRSQPDGGGNLLAKEGIVARFTSEA